MFLSLGESSGRASTTIVGHGKPIDPHSERTELIQSVLVDNIDPVVLLLGTRPEKLHQLTPKAMLAAYFRLLSPVGYNLVVGYNPRFAIPRCRDPRASRGNS